MNTSVISLNTDAMQPWAPNLDDKELRIQAKMAEIRQKQLDQEIKEEARRRLKREEDDRRRKEYEQWLVRKEAEEAIRANEANEARRKEAAYQKNWVAPDDGCFYRWKHNGKSYFRNNKNHVFTEVNGDAGGWVGVYHPASNQFIQCECPEEYFEDSQDS
jgi:hypothetical protein